MIETAIRGSFVRVLLWLAAVLIVVFLFYKVMHERERHQAEALAKGFIATVAEGREYGGLIAPGLEGTVESARPSLISGFRVLACDDVGLFFGHFYCIVRLSSDGFAYLDVGSKDGRMAVLSLQIERPGSIPLVDATARPLPPRAFQGIDDKMTLGQIIERLGPAHGEQGSGLCIVVWHVTDGRVFAVGTARCDRSERPIYAKYK